MYRSDSTSLEDLQAERDKLIKGRDNARKIIEKLLLKDKINADLQLAFSENEDDKIELMKQESDYYDHLYDEYQKKSDEIEQDDKNDSVS